RVAAPPACPLCSSRAPTRWASTTTTTCAFAAPANRPLTAYHHGKGERDMGKNKKGKKSASKRAPEKNEKQLDEKDLDGVAGGSLTFTAPSTVQHDISVSQGGVVTPGADKMGINTNHNVRVRAAR